VLIILSIFLKIYKKCGANILPEVDDISSLIQPIKDWLKSRAKEEDYILVQGDFGANL